MIGILQNRPPRREILVTFLAQLCLSLLSTFGINVFSANASSPPTGYINGTYVADPELWIAENQGSGYIGAFYCVDADHPGQYNQCGYALVPGAGDDDNDSFTIDNIGGWGVLNINHNPDHETQNVYSIRVVTWDINLNTSTKVFTVYVNNVYEPTDPVDPPADPVDPPADPVDPPADPVDPPADPVDPPADPVDPPAQSMDFSLAGNVVSTLKPANTKVGTLFTSKINDPPLTYSIVGSTSLFNINGNELRTSVPFMSPAIFDITVRVTNSIGETFERTFPINVVQDSGGGCGACTSTSGRTGYIAGFRFCLACAPG